MTLPVVAGCQEFMSLSSMTMLMSGLLMNGEETCHLLSTNGGFSTGTDGMRGTCWMGIVIVAVSNPGVVACKTVSPKPSFPCMMTCANPLNSFLLLPFSGSWLLGLPLPKPMMVAGPVSGS